MKFKAQDKQNQLIENITVHHLVIGVDIAQEVHVLARSAFVGLLWELRSNSVTIVKGSICSNAGSKIYSNPTNLAAS